jgi:hypothetical protein
MRLEISQQEIIEGDFDWQTSQLKDFYLLRLIHFANELGLKGKKIKEVIKVKPNFMEALYIDFVCEP